MSITDVLGNAGAVAGYITGAYFVASCGKKLFNKYYIPWTKEVDKELDKEPMNDYKFSDNK